MHHFQPIPSATPTPEFTKSACVPLNWLLIAKRSQSLRCAWAVVWVWIWKLLNSQLGLMLTVDCSCSHCFNVPQSLVYWFWLLRVSHTQNCKFQKKIGKLIIWIFEHYFEGNITRYCTSSLTSRIILKHVGLSCTQLNAWADKDSRRYSKRPTRASLW